MSTKPPPTMSGTHRPSEQLRLSEAARELVLPTGIVSTGWPAVRDKCRDLGIRFQRWQDGAGRCILAKREDGLYAAGIGGVVISIPRQVGKTFLIGAIAFAMCLLFPGLTVLWTAHRVRTANETFKAMQGMARRKQIRPYVEHVRRGSGEQAIEFRNGSRILFGARETGFGRGFANVGVIVFDEGQILTQDALDDMIPAANQAENPLVVYTGTPPKGTDPGEVFTRLRARALAGESENVLYIEFSADPDCDPAKWSHGFVDWAQIAKANPSFPKWTPRAAILRLMEQLGLGSFLLEGLGVWPKSNGPQPKIKNWRGLATGSPPSVGPLVLGVKFSLDGERVAAAVARRPDGAATHTEVVGEWSTADGLQVLGAFVKASWRRFAAVVVDGKAGAGVLYDDLRLAKVPDRVLVLPTVAEVIAAHTVMLTATQDRTVSHFDQPGLNASAAAAATRKIGTAGGWGWEAIGDGDVTPLDAVTLAVWGVVAKARDRRSGSASGWRAVVPS